MKLNRSLWLAALLALMLFSCQKDSFLKEDENDLSPLNGFSTTNGFSNSCLDELDTAYVNQVHRVLSQIIYNRSKQLNQDVGVYGTPVWEGTLSYIEDNEMVSVTPLVGIDSSYVRTLLIITSQNNGYKYAFYPKQYAENIPSGIEGFNSFDIYDLFDCYLFCDKDGVQLRDGPPRRCYNFGDSWWEKFVSWLGGILEEIGDGFGGGSAGSGGGYDSIGIGNSPFGGIINTFPGSGNTSGGTGGVGGNPNYSFGATFDQIQRMIALLEQFRIDENITVPTSMLLDLVPSYCADELANFNYCALDGLKNYVFSNTGIIASEWGYLLENRGLLSSVVSFIFEEGNSFSSATTIALREQIQFLIEENFLYPEYYYPVKDTVFRDATFSSNQKVNCVYNKLRNQNSNLFKSTIRNFIGSKMYNLKLVVVDLPIGDATTTPPDPNQNNLITIKIDPDHISSAYPIELAGTILHEGIHAEMKRYVLAKGGVLRSYPELWYYYTYYKNGGATWPLSEAEHALMAYQYIDDIAASLKILDNNQFSVDHYKYIALQGLERHAINIDQLTRDYYLQLHTVMIANRSKNCVD